MRRWGGCATPGPGDNSRCGPTAASTPTPSSPPAAGWMSASPSPSARVLACAVSSRPYPSRTGRPSPTGWTAPDVAETSYTPFQSKPDAAPVRLIVRRVKPTPGSQLALFATYSYHGFITDREGETLELEADHRRHAEIENAIRDLKYGVGLNHLPSGRFPANPEHAEGGLAGGAGDRPQPGTLDGAHRSGRADRDHQDPATPLLFHGRKAHPLGAPPHFASAPALAGKPSSVAPSLDSERCLSPPDGARPPLTRHPAN